MRTRFVAVVVGAALLAMACGGGTSDEEAQAVCDAWLAVSDAGNTVLKDFDQYEPVLDRADEIDQLKDPAGNIRRSVEHLTSGDPVDLEVEGPDGLRSSVTGFYRKCQDAGWDGLDR